MILTSGTFKRLSKFHRVGDVVASHTPDMGKLTLNMTLGWSLLEVKRIIMPAIYLNAN